MSEFRYSHIEQHLVDALPEIRPAAEFYWQTAGAPGQNSLPYEQHERGRAGEEVLRQVGVAEGVTGGR